MKGLPDEESERRRRIEEYLDHGQGERWLVDGRVAKLVEDALLHFDGERYRLHGWVIMPNHVHALLSPRRGHSVSSIVHSWKSYTAREANRVLGRSGAFWQEDYFDRYIRDARHFQATLEYIENNPVKAGLCRQPEDWPYNHLAARMAATPDGSTGPSLGPSLGPRASSSHDKEHQEAQPRGEQPSNPREQMLEERAAAYADAVATYLAFAVDRSADFWCTIATWSPQAKNELVGHAFGRQAIPMTWDFGEVNPFSRSGGNFEGNLSFII